MARRSLLKYVLPPPFIKAVALIILGAVVITLILYVSGGADYVLAQVWRPGMTQHRECSTGDPACLQQLNARQQASRRCGTNPQCIETEARRIMEESHKVFCKAHNLSCVRRQPTIASSPEPTLPLPRPRPNQRSIGVGNPVAITVLRRYDYVTLTRIYPKAIMLCQSPTVSQGVGQYIQSKLSAWLGSRVTRSEWQPIQVKPTGARTAQAPATLPRSTTGVPLRTTTSPTSSPRTVISASPTDERLIDGATLAPLYTPPAPYGTRNTADGCWYFAPDANLRGNHAFTVPADVATGQGIIKILEGQLQPNRIVESEVRSSLRSQLGRTPTAEEVRAAVAARPDRYRERISDYTYEQVFVAGTNNQSATPTRPPSAGSVVSWLEAKTLLAQCRVVSASQNHARHVVLVLNDGRRVESTEPAIDHLITLAQDANRRCGTAIAIATE